MVSTQHTTQNSTHHAMKRKVVQQGPSTLMISLPSAWVKQYHIKKGDELELTEVDRDLKISFRTASPDLERIEYDISRLEPFALRALGAMYKSGYDEVYLRFDTLKTIEKVSEQMTDLMPGYEVMDQGKNFCVVKNIAQSIESEFDTILRRIFLVTLSMAKTTVDLVKAKEYRSLIALQNLETTNNKLCNFCERLLNKHGYAKPRKICFIYAIIWELEKLCDEYKYLGDFLMNHPPQHLDTRSVDMLDAATKLFVLFYETFYKFDQEKCAKLAKERKSIVEKANELYLSAKTHDLKVVHHSVNIAQMVFNMQGCYLGLIL